ncbi:MAG: hypothetical protein AB8G96_08875 [Phycisphaerales bacterium]
MHPFTTSCAIFILAAGATAADPWHDSFEGYPPGPLVGLGGWEAWNDQPNAGGFLVTDQESRDDVHALTIAGQDHAVQTFADCTSGTWAFTTWIWVPADMDDDQTIVLLNTYPAGAPSDASLHLDLSGAANVIRDHNAPEHAQPLVRGQWSRLSVVIDLDADEQHVFYEGQPLLSKSWTGGIEPGGAARIAAVALSGQGSQHPVQYDTMFMEPLSIDLPCSADLDGNGAVGFEDVLATLAAWGSCPKPCPPDLDGSGTVDFADLLAVLAGFGPCPRFALLPPESIDLDPSGSWSTPDFSSPVTMAPWAINPLAFAGPVLVQQQPEPGTVFAGEQPVAGAFVAVDDDGPHGPLTTTIPLIDATPPLVMIQGVADGDVFVVPMVVEPTIVVDDSIDPNPALELLVNGEPADLPLQLEAPGRYVLLASATDAAGNVGQADPVVVEIAAHPMAQATTLVADMQVQPQPGGLFALDVNMLLASDEFQPLDLSLYTLGLWPMNESGLPLTQQPIPLAGSVDEEGGYDFAATEAFYQNGYWTLHFSATMPEDLLFGLPAYFEITGTGRHTQPGEFDLNSITPAIVEPNPLNVLEGLGLINDDPPALPQPEPQWAPCKWKSSITLGPVDLDQGGPSGSCFGGVQQWSKYLRASGARFRGTSTSIDECTGNAATSAAVSSTAIMRVWLEGPAGCCGPEIECVFQPTFRAGVNVNGPADALAAGLIDIASSCACNTRAVGALAIGEGAPPEVTFGAGASVGADGPSVGANVEVSTTLAGSNDDSEVFNGNCVGIVQKRAIVISIVSNARLKTRADADIFDWYARSRAQLLKATPGITVTATCTSDEGPCAGATETFTYK